MFAEYDLDEDDLLELGLDGRLTFSVWLELVADDYDLDLIFYPDCEEYVRLGGNNRGTVIFLKGETEEARKEEMASQRKKWSDIELDLANFSCRKKTLNYGDKELFNIYAKSFKYISTSDKRKRFSCFLLPACVTCDFKSQSDSKCCFDKNYINKKGSQGCSHAFDFLYSRQDLLITQENLSKLKERYPLEKDVPPYLDSDHPFYIPELAAAVEVWLAIYENGDVPVSENSTVKVNVMKWIENSKFKGLIKKTLLVSKRIATLLNYTGKRHSLGTVLRAGERRRKSNF